MKEELVPVSTIVRPIKKIFIIDNNDFSTFIKIIKFLTTEINGSNNLIFTTEQINEPVIKKLIKLNNTDIIINYSSIPNGELNHFKKEVVDSEGRLHFLKTDFYQWNQRVNDIFFDSTDLKDISIFYNANDNICSENIENILCCGIVDDLDEWKLFYELSMFKNCKLLDVSRNEPDKFQNATSILELSSLLSTSSYRMNHETNPNNYFANEDKKVVVIGDSENLESILYFWNERALYHSSNIKFVDINNHETLKGIESFQFVVNFKGDDELRIIKEINPDIISINKKYYFDGEQYLNENFKHISYAIKQEKYIQITHPREKSFVKHGVQNFMLEIRGIKESYLPYDNKFYDLFQTGLFSSSDYRFSSYSDNTISIYLHRIDIDFSLLDITTNLYIPTSDDILQKFTVINDLTLQITNKTKLFKNLYKYFNSNKIIHILRDKAYFDLLISMTPKRMSHLLNKINELSKDINEKKIEETLKSFVTYKSDIISSFNDIRSKFKGDKSQLYSNLEHLIHKNVLLRGKKIICPVCDSELWFSTDNLMSNLTCYCCNNDFKQPLAMNNQIIQDSVKLNELIIDSIDQGQFTMLLINKLIEDQPAIYKNIYYNLNVLKSTKIITDIDILAILNDKIYFIEVKSNRIFDFNQTINLIEVSNELEIDGIILVTLLNKKDKDVTNFVDKLKNIEIKKDIIIFTQEAIFTQNTVKINELLGKGIIVL